ncbi:MAG: methyltransferase domain-containing protein [Phormidesmis sp.]
MSKTVWNATAYQEQFGYVWHYGKSLIEQLAPQPGERSLDLGCGTGQLTNQIAEQGATVIGLDKDSTMIASAQTNYPILSLKVDSADCFHISEPVDAIFSNAALHWVLEAKAAASCMANALKSGGRIVAELGGAGNVQTILTALSAVSGKRELSPWYFPRLGDYVALLEATGLTVTYAHLFDRPTPLGEAGLAGWLEMFSQRFFPELSAEEWTELVKAVEKEAANLYQNKQWIADYRRLRIVAAK